MLDRFRLQNERLQWKRELLSSRRWVLEIMKFWWVLLELNINYIIFNDSLFDYFFIECHFEPVFSEKCPSNPKDLRSCTENMNHTQMCEADKELPNGQRDIDVNNCRISANDTCSPHCEYDVFRCIRGTQLHSFLP